MKKDIIVGVTGGFGTGKTTVARMFATLGAAVINADKIAHDVIAPEGGVYKKVISLFGKAILKRNGRIDRKKLGKIVFADKKKLSLLNSVIHPEVIRRVREAAKERKSRSKKVFVIDVPLLIEAGLEEMMDKIVVVTIDQKTQIKRCTKKWSLSREAIMRRIRNQMSLSKKRQLADFIIDNNGSFDATKKEVKKIWREMKNGARKC